MLKNRSEIQPDTLHADTQGQSEPVFGLCRLLGIKLMPRMRGLGDVTFYRPAKAIRYEHIDALFTADIDWDLIATHARDMIQVVLSIQAGRVMPSMLLRKLGTYNRRSLLYRAFRELGRVERTLFLLRFFSKHRSTPHHPRRNHQDRGLQRLPGLDLVRRPRDQERRSRRAGEAAQIRQPRRQHDHAVQRRRPYHPPSVTPGLVAATSPYIRGHILRFGQYALNMGDLPGPLDPQPLPFEPIL